MNNPKSFSLANKFRANLTLAPPPTHSHIECASNGYPGKAPVAALVLALVALVAPASAAQPEGVSFQGLGDLPGGPTESCAISVSHDGRCVTGWSATEKGTRAFLWTDNKLEELSEDAEGLAPNVGHAVSDGCRCIVGVAQSKDGPRAFRWQAGRLESLPAPSGMQGTTDAWGISADGAVIVGHLNSHGRDQALVWRHDEASVLAGPPGETHSSIATAISADGSTIVGRSVSNHGTEAVVWREGRFSRLQGLAREANHAEAYGLGADGTVIVGSSASPFGNEGCLWRSDNSIGLGSLSREHEFLSVARDISADGALVVGYAIDDRDQSQAVAWDQPNGIRPLQLIFAADFGINVDGWRLDIATSISGDGRTIVGCGRNPQGRPEGWIARLPANWWRDNLIPPQRPSGSADGQALQAGNVRLDRAIGVFDDLTDPHGVAIGPGGKTYVADTGRNLVHIFSANGERLGTLGSLGSGIRFDAPYDVAAAPDGTLYVAEAGASRIQVLDKDGRLRLSWNGLQSASTPLNRPQGVAIHGDLVYVADTGNDRVVLFGPSGERRRSLGRPGHGIGELDRPADVTVCDGGRVIVADTGNHRLCVFDAQGEWVGAWGERGSSPGLFTRPTGVDCRGSRVYVVDQANHRIQVFRMDGTLDYVWGRQSLRPHEAGGRIMFPSHIALSQDQTYAVICESSEDRCQWFGLAQRLEGFRETSVTMSDARPLSAVSRIFHVDGDMLAAVDDANEHVLVYRLSDQSAALGTKVGTPGFDVGQFGDVQGLAYEGSTNRLYVSDAGNRRILVFELNLPSDPSQGYVPNLARLLKTIDLSTADGPSGLNERAGPFRPGTLAIGPNSRLAVVNAVGNQVLVLGRESKEHTRLGGAPGAAGELKRPVDVAFGRDGKRIFVLDAARHGVVAFDGQGTYIGFWGIGGTETAKSVVPSGMEAGPDGFVYICDLAGHHVLKFDEDGRFIAKFGVRGIRAGEFFKPCDVSADSRGRLYVNDLGNRRVQVLTSDGQFLWAMGSPLWIHPTLNKPRE